MHFQHRPGVVANRIEHRALHHREINVQAIHLRWCLEFSVGTGEDDDTGLSLVCWSLRREDLSIGKSIPLTKGIKHLH